VLVAKPVGASEEKSPRPDGGHVLNVGSRRPNKLRVVVANILSYSDSFRHARWIRPRGKTSQEVRARTERFHFILHELVEPLNDRRHGNYRRNPNYDSEHGQGGPHFGGVERLHSRDEIFACLRQGHERHQSDLKATTGSNREARTAG